MIIVKIFPTNSTNLIKTVDSGYAVPVITRLSLSALERVMSHTQHRISHTCDSKPSS